MYRQGCRYLILGIVSGLLAGCQTAPRRSAPAEQLVVSPPNTQEPVAHPVSLNQRSSPAADTSPVEWVAHQQPEPLPAPTELRTPEAVTAGIAAAPLHLGEVIASVQESYPLLASAVLERSIADGKQVSAWGEFDLNIKAFGIAAPEGYYQTYRNGISVQQPVFPGGYVYGGYKIGDGKFQPWYKERETNEGGEFSAGLSVPLLQNRSIDKRRAAVFQAELARQAVEPTIRAQLLEFVRVAAQTYWSWVAAGQSLKAQRELLQNAQSRVRQIEEKVKAGDLPRIARINNEQLIASRETKVIESERKLQKAAIKLSLFLRNSKGEPTIPDALRLPAVFPNPVPPNAEQLDTDIQSAVAASPALRELDLIAEQVRVESRNAENQLLPKLDARFLASKDVGAQANAKGDKTPFELETGLYGELPLQRRSARGKIAAAQGKLRQINAKRVFVVNKITAAVQDAVSALQAASNRISRAENNLRLARETLRLGRLQFDAGDIDLVTLNIYEKSVTDAQLLLITAHSDFFSAVADYRAALAQEPLSTE